MHLFLAALGAHCRPCFSLAVESGGYSLGVVRQLLLVAVASLLAEHGLYLQASVGAVRGLSFPGGPVVMTG